MSKRAFTPRPKEKSEDYHGGCQINSLPDAYKPGSKAKAVPKSLNMSLTFEEALKLSVAINSCVQALNRYDRRNKGMGLGMTVMFDTNQISVMECKV